MAITNDLIENTGTCSVANGASVATFVGATLSGRNREAAQLWIQPAAAAPYRVGSVAEVDPKGVYENTELPLVSPWNGVAIVDQPYELIDSVVLATSASLTAVVARWVANLSNYAGLVYNTLDDYVIDRVQNNSLLVDSVTRIIYQWRGGVLVPLQVVGIAFTPRGEYAGGTTYAMNDLVEYHGYLFVSNEDSNTGNAPNYSTPDSDSHWTWYPTPTAAAVAAAALVLLGLNSVTISESAPVGTGTEGDLHIQVEA